MIEPEKAPDREEIPGLVFFAPEERENLARCKEPEGRRGTGFVTRTDCAPEAGRENPCTNTVCHCAPSGPAGAHHPIAGSRGLRHSESVRLTLLSGIGVF
jgi:hypothetical protein